MGRRGVGYNRSRSIVHRFDEHCHRVMTELIEAGRVLDEYRPDLGDQLRAETARFADLLRDIRDEVGSEAASHPAPQQRSA